MHKAFEVHRLNEVGMKRAGEIASIFDLLLRDLESLVPDSWEKAIVVTKLEEACFFAKKAMASLRENHD